MPEVTNTGSGGTDKTGLKNYKCDNCGSTEHYKLFDVRHKNGSFSVVRCSCGLSFMNPRPPPEYLDQYYDRDYFDGDKKDFTSWQEHPADLAKDVIDIPEFGKRKNGRFLDIGCGIGVYVAYMKYMGWEARGLDISRYSTDLGKKKYGLDLFCGTLDEAGYPDGYFHAIYMRDVIEHLSEPKSMLKEISRILHPEGRFVIATGNIGSIVGRLRQYNWFYLQPDHIHYFSLSSLEDMLERSGLKIIKMGSEYCYGRSISELRRRGAPRMWIRIPEFIMMTKIAPVLYSRIGTSAAELFSPTMSLHIKKIASQKNEY